MVESLGATSPRAKSLLGILHAAKVVGMRHAKRLDFDLPLRVIAREAVAVVNDQLMQELEQVTRAPQFFQGMDQIRVADTLIDQISQIDPVSGVPGVSAATES